MNILEIERDCAWWFQAATGEELQQLRQIALRCGSEARADTFAGCNGARAFCLRGDAATFNLRDGTFEEIHIAEDSPKRRSALERRARRWLTPGGRFVFGVTRALASPAAAPLVSVQAVSREAFDKVERVEPALEPAVRSLAPLTNSLF